MKQSEITVRVDLHRGPRAGHDLDLRPELRLRQDQRRLPELTLDVCAAHDGAQQPGRPGRGERGASGCGRSGRRARRTAAGRPSRRAWPRRSSRAPPTSARAGVATGVVARQARAPGRAAPAASAGTGRTGRDADRLAGRSVSHQKATASVAIASVAHEHARMAPVRADALAEEGRHQGGAGPGDRQPVADQAGVRGRPVIDRRADGGEHQRQREHAPGSQRRCWSPAPTQAATAPRRRPRGTAGCSARSPHSAGRARRDRRRRRGSRPTARSARAPRAARRGRRSPAPASWRAAAGAAGRREERGHAWQGSLQMVSKGSGGWKATHPPRRAAGPQALRAPCRGSALAVARRASRRRVRGRRRARRAGLVVGRAQRAVTFVIASTRGRC